MSTIEILSPVALGPSERKPLAPRVPALAGKVLGIRIDRAWRSWWQAADEIALLGRRHDGQAVAPALCLDELHDGDRIVGHGAEFGDERAARHQLLSASSAISASKRWRAIVRTSDSGRASIGCGRTSMRRSG